MNDNSFNDIKTLINTAKEASHPHRLMHSLTLQRFDINDAESTRKEVHILPGDNAMMLHFKDQEIVLYSPAEKFKVEINHAGFRISGMDPKENYHAKYLAGLQDMTTVTDTGIKRMSKMPKIKIPSRQESFIFS